MAGRFDQRKHGPKPEQQTQKDTDLEQEGLEQTGPEIEQNRAQNQVGNAAMASMVGSGTAGGGGGVEMELEGPATRRDSEKEGVDYGGEDDPVDGPITALGLTRAGSPNPRRKRQADADAWEGDLYDQSLPAEDRTFLLIARSWPAAATPADPLRTLDPLVQPSRPLVERSLVPWAKALRSWCGTREERLLATLLCRPPAALQDQEGRMLMSRARTGALGTWLALGSPVLQSAAPVAEAVLFRLLLELRGRTFCVDAAVQKSTETVKRAIPEGARVLAALIEPSGRRPTRSPDPRSIPLLMDTMRQLCAFEPSGELVPSYTEPPEPEPEPELEGLIDIDAVIAEFTKEVVPDPEAAAYQAAVHAAERLAAAIVQTRVRLAGCAYAVVDATSSWPEPVPGALLMEAIKRIDQESQAHLKLVVEVARAAKRKTVSVVGVHRGLRRVSKGIERTRAAGLQTLAAMAASALPAAATGQMAPVSPGAVEQSFNSRVRIDPSQAQSEVERLLARIARGDAAARLLGPLEDALASATKEGAERWVGIWGSLLGNCQLTLADADGALRTAHLLEGLGVRRRNPLVLADATLLGLEALRLAGDPHAADRLRFRVGRRMHDMGSPAGLTLLARWTPPLPDVV